MASPPQAATAHRVRGDAGSSIPSTVAWWSCSRNVRHDFGGPGIGAPETMQATGTRLPGCCHTVPAGRGPVRSQEAAAYHRGPCTRNRRRNHGRVARPRTSRRQLRIGVDDWEATTVVVEPVATAALADEAATTVGSARRRGRDDGRGAGRRGRRPWSRTPDDDAAEDRGRGGPAGRRADLRHHGFRHSAGGRRREQWDGFQRRLCGRHRERGIGVLGVRGDRRSRLHRRSRGGVVRAGRHDRLATQARSRASVHLRAAARGRGPGRASGRAGHAGARRRGRGRDRRRGAGGGHRGRGRSGDRRRRRGGDGRERRGRHGS